MAQHQTYRSPAGNSTQKPRLQQSSSGSSRSDKLNGRVLLVEDDQDHQLLLSLMLRRAGAEVTVAENGKVAVELVAATRDEGPPFEAIVMDVQMPVLDGRAATRLLRCAGFDGRIIVLTARAMTDERQKCFEAGCDAFLAKPVDRAKLVDLLAFHLAKPAFTG